MKKKQLGQFFTKNNDYILSGLEGYVKDKNVTDPFAGAGDLLDWAQKNGAASVQGFDVDRQYVDNVHIKYNDSLKKPKIYDFVLTNPPYLYQNKMQDNSLLAKSKHTDLYQLSLEKIISSNEGIVIVPINLLSSENAKYIRDVFFEKHEILKCNYFTEQVFSDTTYNVIAFYYRRKTKPNSKMNFTFTIYPEKTQTQITVYKNFNWQIGGEFLGTIKNYENKLNITRLEEDDLKQGRHTINAAYNHLSNIKTFSVDDDILNRIKQNVIVLKAIDTGTEEGKICLEDIRRYNLDALVSIKTSRNQIFLLLPEFVSVAEQEQIIHLFNQEIEEKRKKYFSLFMTNFRDKNRKRISFNFAYNLINYLYFAKVKEDVNERQPALF